MGSRRFIPISPDSHRQLRWAQRIKEKTIKLALEMERLVNEAPADTRRALRRIAEGDLGRVQPPAMESLASRVSHDLERLTSAITAAALVVSGSLPDPTR